MSKQHPFNKYLEQHYNYKSAEEEEIRCQIYTNKETNDFISMVTILKSVWFKAKAEVRTIVNEGTIYLEVTVRYFQKVTPEEVTCLIENLKKQLKHDNILITAEVLPEEKFNNLRVKEL
jgi:hypothetical protein